MRNSDDCIALYAHRWNFWGDTQNILLENSVLWADVAHPVNIGGHGNPDGIPGERVGNITVRNVDILEHDEDDPLYQGCMSVNVGDRNLVHDVLFEDIRVESIQEGCLFYIRVAFNPKYDKQPGRGMENITFRNIRYDGIGEKLSLIKGYDADRCVQNVTFENVIINGQKLKDTRSFRLNEFVHDIWIK